MQGSKRCQLSYEGNNNDQLGIRGSGYPPDAQWISESFYSHSSPFTHPTPQQLEAKAVLASFGGPGAVEQVAVLGHGTMPPVEIFTGPAYLGLILWVLHPRKGCSRGWEVLNIKQKDLPTVYQFLRTAAERNAERFSLIPTLVEGEPTK